MKPPVLHKLLQVEIVSLEIGVKNRHIRSVSPPLVGADVCDKIVDAGVGEKTDFVHYVVPGVLVEFVVVEEIVLAVWR